MCPLSRVSSVQDCEPYVELAISVFKTQSLSRLQSLKNFLTVLPTPECIEQVLTLALHQLADKDPEGCRWLLKHSDYLLPELDLTEHTLQLLQTVLINQGFLVGEDFKIDPDGCFYLSETAKTGLGMGMSLGDRLLLEEILHIYSAKDST